MSNLYMYFQNKIFNVKSYFESLSIETEILNSSLRSTLKDRLLFELDQELNNPGYNEKRLTSFDVNDYQVIKNLKFDKSCQII